MTYTSCRTSCAADIPVRIQSTCCSTCSFWASATCWCCAATRPRKTRHSVLQATVIHMPRNLSGTSTVSMTVSSSTVRPSSLPAHRFHTVWLAIRKNMRKHPIRKPTWPCSNKKPTWVPHTPSPSCSTTMQSISTSWTVHAEPASPSPSSRASSRLPNCHNSA